MDEKLQLVVFEIDAGRFALALPQVERVIRAVAWTPLPEAPATVLGVIDVGGEVVPLLDMRKRLGLPERLPGVEDQMIVARTARRAVALVVDLVRGIAECVAKEVLEGGRILPGMEAIQGIVKLPDGLLLIHDLDKFLSLEEERVLEGALRGGESHAA